MRTLLYPYLFLLLLSVQGCAEETNPPKVLAYPKIHKLSNAYLENLSPPWSLQKFEYDVELQCEFISQEKVVSFNTDKYHTHIYLNSYKVTKLVSGEFSHPELKFLIENTLKEGVRYKQLLLRGKLTFYLKQTPTGFKVTNVARGL